MSTDKQVVLKVNNLKQFFITGKGKYRIFNKAVNGISFEINRGEVFSLVGESGCGKTTTGRTIMRLYKPTDGEVFLLGKRIVGGDLSLREEIYAINRQIKNLSTNSPTYKNDLGELTNKKRLIQYDIKQRKADQKTRYTPDRHLISEVKKESIAQTDTLKKELKKVNEEFLAFKKEAFVEFDNLPLGTSSEEKEALHHKLLAKYREVRSIKNKRVEQINYEISHCYTAHKFYARPLLNKIQMIFQDPIDSLDPRMTVKDIVAEGLYINGIHNRTVVKERVYNALKLVGLMPEHASHFPHEFSGGQRQRVGIARAIVCEPEIIVADEPISALDVSIQAQVINLLNDLKTKLGLTILFIAHDLSVVKYFSDKIAVMYYGRIVEMGEKTKVFNNPLHPYTLSLISSIPLPDPTYEKLRTGVKRYNPTAHNYQKDEVVSLREVEPNHFVLCNEAEFAKYLKIINK
ncbi:MAG: ATP-binding cassette domain-containing protein [Acholeplasmatales bacterium]|jgi:oligopeptide transport system ATP-binding protein|nr:ATP-binding cassette domain-containing protein [Acholeplasmatales bacterium]